MIRIKKLITFVLMICLTSTLLPRVSFGASGSNVSTVGPGELPDAGIFEDTAGNMFSKSSYEQWLKEGIPDVLVDNMLRDNVAFVVDSNYYWNKTKRISMKEAPVYNEAGEVLIPTTAVNEAFNISLSGDYVDSKKILNAAKGWQSFTDPRGFVLFSRNIDSVINKDPAVEGQISGRHYRSYYDVQLAIAKITWNDINPTKDDWKIARSKMYNALTLVEGTASKYENYIKELVDSVNSYIDKLDVSEDATVPFTDVALYASFQRIVEMAKVYTILRDNQRNDINLEKLKTTAMSAFDFLADNWIGKNVSMDSNWFFNRITYPLAMAQFMIMMYDEMDYSRIEEVCANLMVRTGSNIVSTNQVPFKYFTDGTAGVPTNSYSNYTNLLWQTATNYTIYLLVENTPRMNDNLKYLYGIFEEVRNSDDNEVNLIKDGVYSDGSFVFHACYAYNMGYGYSYVGTLGPMVALTAGTAFDIQNIHGFSKVYEWIEKSWIPFIYSNTRTRISSGREKAIGLSGKGNVLVKSLLLLAENAHDSKGKATIERLLKPIIDEYYEDYIKHERIPIIYFYTYPTINEQIRSYMDYIRYELDEEEVQPYNYSYYNMDKFVHKRNDYTFMLSLSSERIDKYEAINNEGYTDWYVSDGMTYLLMDPVQYLIGWWENVDRYAIPGTTVDSSERSSTFSSYGTVMPNNPWAGGASDGMIATAAMQLPSVAANKSSYVLGTKSYFMLDDKIICMGTGINGGKGEVYTTVENYLSSEPPPENIVAVRKDGYVEVLVDDENMPFVFDESVEYENPKYISLNNDRGWVFFENNNVSIERVVKNKRYAGMDKTINESAYDIPFVTVKIEHGENPENARYGYVILPNKTAEQVKEYSQQMDFEVVEQSESRHVIKLGDGTIMANLFVPGALEGITFKSPCSVILKPTSIGWDIHLSEPTQRLKSLQIELPDDGIVTGNSVEMRGRTAYVAVGADYGSTYQLHYTTQDNIGKELDNGKNDAIRTYNINLKTGMTPISTKLYASSLIGGELTFEIGNSSELAGRAYIVGKRLYYIPPAAETSVDEAIVINVTDDAENAVSYTISISARK